MTDSARGVIAKWLAFSWGVQNPVSEDELKDADEVLTALRKAGFAPPLHTGVLHKALQDAFQYGVEKGIDLRVVPGNPSTWLINRKHEYCDAALEAMLKAAQGGVE